MFSVKSNGLKLCQYFDLYQDAKDCFDNAKGHYTFLSLSCLNDLLETYTKG